MSKLRALSHLLAGAALVVSGACGKGGERDGTAGANATGEVAAIDYEVTPDRYQRWVAAQQALDATPNLPAPPRIDPMSLGEAEIRRAVEYLEGDPRARAALARARISARDYVLTTIALDQALVAANTTPAAGVARPSAAQPVGGAATAPPRAVSATARPRITGAPATNVELVRQNRGDVVRVLRAMRFRISEPDPGDIVDTTVTRTDSMNVGKDISVKWDVTVRRKRDTTTRGKSAASDSARPDSTR